jgi:5-enolpyruvylshikimate-3-phosphate synthase
MAMAVAGLVAKAGVEVEGAESISESFPNFPELMNSLGAQMA